MPLSLLKAGPTRLPAAPRRRQCLYALALLLTMPAMASVTQATASERSVKAAFLYKFLGYTEFPATAFGDTSAPVVIGVLGADDLAAELGRIVNGRTVQSRPIVVKVLHDPESAAGVHLLFVGGNDNARVRNQLKAVPPGPMLVVSEADDGLQQGSVINFRVVDEHVRFDVSLDAAEKNSVKLSSRLLTVANHVQKGAP
ncbi:MAG: YfiR family protein [Massilia sp.]